MKYKTLTKNKTYLMGVAIILIILFHSTIYVDNTIFTFIKSKLLIGVDIFLFLSGIGMVYSYKKCKTKKEFYIKRLKKILPIYIPVAIIFSLYFYLTNYFTAIDFYANITMTNFLFKIGNYPIWYWYIPSIIILYFLSPFIINFYKKNETKKFLILLFSAILLILITIPEPLNNYLVFTTRIPIFLIGIYVGIKSYNGDTLENKKIIQMLIFTILSLIIMVITRNKYYWFSAALSNLLLIFPTISISFIFSILINYLKRFKIKFSILQFLGNRTLEIYILHERIIILCTTVIFKYFTNLANMYTINIISIIITIIVASLLNKVIKSLNNESTKVNHDF